MTKTARVPDAANTHFQPILQVELGGITWPVYGSMTHTVNETRKGDWAAIRQSYIAITGDQRPEVDQELAKNVVAGELQIKWAQYKKREDLLPSIERHHKQRIEKAVTSVQSDDAPKKRVTERPLNPPTGARTMSEENTASGGTATAEGGEATTKRAAPERFSRGVMGTAAREIRAGNLDEASIIAKCEAENAGCKPPGRHIRYVAKELDVKLNKVQKAAPVAAAPSPEAAQATELPTSNGDNTVADEPTAG